MADFELSPFTPSGNFALLEIESEEPISIAAREDEFASIDARIRAAGVAAAVQSGVASVVARVVVHASAAAVEDERINEPDVTIYIDQAVIALENEVAAVDEPSTEPSELHAVGSESVSIQAHVLVHTSAAANEDEAGDAEATVRVASTAEALATEAGFADSRVVAHGALLAVEDEAAKTGVGGVIPFTLTAVEDESAAVQAGARVHSHAAAVEGSAASIAATVRVTAAASATESEASAVAHRVRVPTTLNAVEDQWAKAVGAVRGYSTANAHEGESAEAAASVRVGATVAAHESEQGEIGSRVRVAASLAAIENEVASSDPPDLPATQTGGAEFRVTGAEFVDLRLSGGPVVTFRIGMASMRWKARNANTLVIEDARNSLEKGRPAITSANVTAIIVDSEGNQIEGVVQPVSLSPIEGLGNWYGAAIPATAVLVPGQSYTAQITFIGPGDNEVAYREESITVEAP